MTDDLRESVRHRTLKGGRITFNEGRSTISCTIRNMSETGALLRVESVIGVPETFDLVMDDGRQFACTIARRTPTEIGVHFSE